MARFQREARAAARLQHPNIVTIYELGEVDGTLFIAMELLEGMDLAEAMTPADRLPLDPEAARRRRHLPRPRLRPQARRLPSRREARQRAHPQGRHGQDRGLRDRAPRGLDHDADRHGARHAELHGARGAARRARRPSRRHVGRGHRPVRDAARARGPSTRRRSRRSSTRSSTSRRRRSTPRRLGLPPGVAAVVEQRPGQGPGRALPRHGRDGRRAAGGLGLDALGRPAAYDRGAPARLRARARRARGSSFAEAISRARSTAARRAQALEPSRPEILAFVQDLEERLRDAPTLRQATAAPLGAQAARADAAVAARAAPSPRRPPPALRPEALPAPRARRRLRLQRRGRLPRDRALRRAAGHRDRAACRRRGDLLARRGHRRRDPPLGPALAHAGRRRCAR